uniref:Uncharacterized protein n=1 Tax=uncultured Desulfobacterium sp. TaxID=201089 RepID=E1YKQ8_9BACT|nr:unknown protein [uncultured Desulfobacterium sp.]
MDLSCGNLSEPVFFLNLNPYILLLIYYASISSFISSIFFAAIGRVDENQHLPDYK